MTDTPRSTREDAVSDTLLGVFGGINAALAAHILDGEPDADTVAASGVVDADFEYRGLFTDPDFSGRLTFAVTDDVSEARIEYEAEDEDAVAATEGESPDPVDSASDQSPEPEDDPAEEAVDVDIGDAVDDVDVEDRAVPDDVVQDESDGDESTDFVEELTEEDVEELDADSEVLIDEDDDEATAEDDVASAITVVSETREEPETTESEYQVSVDQIVRVERLISGIREDGHHAANIDPLGLLPRNDDHLRPERYGIAPETLAASSSLLADASDEIRPWHSRPTIGAAIEELKRSYCGTIGYELDHIHSVEERLWLQDQVENQSAIESLSDAQRRYQLELLTKVEGFERFLHAKFPGKRWYGLEGLEALVPLIDQIILHSAFNVKQIVMGMPHRGRLNVLAHILEQPYESLLTGFLEGRFAHLAAMEAAGWMTDVKYHLGSRADVDVNHDGNIDVQLRLLPNPSHLEMVNPVVLGAVRSIQDESENDVDPHSEAMALLIHGDAAFAGQGIVAETLNLVNLSGYTVGGAIHVIANNQLGFTTEPQESYSGQYSSDIARGYEIPVVHVNADDLVACALVAKMAVTYRLKFRKEFVIDLVGYRRHGHNENDEPLFTQPRMYSMIGDHPTLRELWADRLLAEEVVSQNEVDGFVMTTTDALNTAYASVESAGSPSQRQAPADLGLQPEPMHGEDYPDTSVTSEFLTSLNEQINTISEGFEMHPTVRRVFSRRREAITESKPAIDWAHAESLAIGALLQEGTGVRLTGQDSARGTFSQRHAAVWDVKTGETYCPLMSVGDGKFSVYNSPLSEAGPVGFEHGYSVFSDSSLVLWEAQFGDFANNAQGIIDEMIVSAQEKWGQRSNLVLLLPHGYEGQGPNHSHAHLERFLDLASRGNMRVANPTTAAQYFHLLRTQAALIGDAERARPLVVMTPKSLLRHPMAAASPAELTDGKFRPIRRFTLSDSAPDAVKRVVLCSGKVFVDLATHPRIGDVKDTGIIVIEELYPFPEELITEAFESFSNYEDVVWLQEEPRNRGAWDFVRTPLASIIKAGVQYIGRPRSPSPASGSNWLHRRQQDRLIRTALKLEADD